MTTDFRDLRVWEAAMSMAEAVYALAGELPADERFGLSSQLKRTAVSVPSCIAEGNARESTRDYLRFLAMASGSLAELQTQVLLAARLKLIAEGRTQEALSKVRSVHVLLQPLRKSLRAKLEGARLSPFPIPRSRTTEP